MSLYAQPASPERLYENGLIHLQAAAELITQAIFELESVMPIEEMAGIYKTRQRVLVIHDKVHELLTSTLPGWSGQVVRAADSPAS